MQFVGFGGPINRQKKENQEKIQKGVDYMAPHLESEIV
jgi:hypothetical protein